MTKESEYLTHKNRTFTYMLPMLGDSSADFRNIKQCFLGDESYPDEKGRLYLLQEISNETWFNTYFKELIGHPMFEKHYKVKDKYIMLVFKLDKEKEKIYNKFKKGQYSTFKESYKKHILKFHELPFTSSIAQILYRAENKYKEWEKRLQVEIPRTQEIGNMPDLQFEMFNEERMFIK